MEPEEDVNIHPDRAHAGKPEHIDFTTRLPEINGADKIEVDYNGNPISGETFVEKQKIKWY